MEQPTQRQQWTDQQHELNAQRLGIVPGAVGGSFAPPEHLTPAAEDDITLRALYRVATGPRNYDGTLTESQELLGGSSHWNRLAAGPEHSDGKSVTTDLHIADYLEKRAAKVSAAAPEIERQYSEAMDTLKEGLRAGIAQGYVPAFVEQRFATLQKTTVQVVDSELLQDDGPGHLQRTRLGVADLKGRHDGLNEALTQHVTMGALTGDFETIDPDQRADGDKIYYAVRKVLAGVVDQSDGIVNAKAFTRALFEDTDTGAPSLEDRRHLVSVMRHAYGPGALRRLDTIFNAALMCWT